MLATSRPRLRAATRPRSRRQAGPSPGVRPNKRVVSSLVIAKVAGRPKMMPAAASLRGCRSTSQITCAVRAPSATRTPISVVRCSTRKVTSANSPIASSPRADRRHITPEDVHDIARALEGRRPGVEFNIEGDPRPDLLELVLAVRPDQCTLVPVLPGEITSQAGWRRNVDAQRLSDIVRSLKADGVRVSLFVDPAEEGIRLAAAAGAARSLQQYSFVP